MDHFETSKRQAIAVLELIDKTYEDHEDTTLQDQVNVLLNVIWSERSLKTILWKQKEVEFWIGPVEENNAWGHRILKVDHNILWLL